VISRPGIWPMGERPAVIGPVEREGLLAPAPAVEERPNRPHTAVRDRDTEKIVERASGRGNLDGLPSAIAELLHQRMITGNGIDRLPDRPNAVTPDRNGVEERRICSQRGRGHRGPVPTVPVLDQRFVMPSGVELLAHRPGIVRSSRRDPKEVAAARARVRRRDDGPAFAVPVFRQRLEPPVRSFLVADGPDV